jgi:hypothetical protein
MLDYDSARSKLRKIIDKPSEDPMKLPRVRLFSPSPHVPLNLTSSRLNKSTTKTKKLLIY